MSTSIDLRTSSTLLKASRRSRPRAPKACLECRGRKVRCNVAAHGAPCTNCRLDDFACVVDKGPRPRRRLDPIAAKPTTPHGSPNYPSPVDSISTTENENTTGVDSLNLTGIISTTEIAGNDDSMQSLRTLDSIPPEPLLLYEGSEHDPYSLSQDMDSNTLHDMPLTQFTRLDAQQQALELKLSAALLYHDLKRIMRPNRVRDLEAAIDNYGLEVDALDQDERQRRAAELHYSFQAMKRARAAILTTDQSLAVVEASLCMPRGAVFCRHRKAAVASRPQGQRTEDQRQLFRMEGSNPSKTVVRQDKDGGNPELVANEWDACVMERLHTPYSRQQSEFPQFLGFADHATGLQGLLEQNLRENGIATQTENWNGTI